MFIPAFSYQKRFHRAARNVTARSDAITKKKPKPKVPFKHINSKKQM